MIYDIKLRNSWIASQAREPAYRQAGLCKLAKTKKRRLCEGFARSNPRLHFESLPLF